jgi:hypothetical protein
MILIN